MSQLTPSSLVLSWSGPSYDGGSQITDYVVEMQSLGAAESGDWSVLTSQCKDTTYRVGLGLDAQGRYRFRVRACNAVGVSEPSEESDCIRMETAGTRYLRLYSYDLRTNVFLQGLSEIPENPEPLFLRRGTGGGPATSRRRYRRGAQGEGLLRHP